MLSYGSTSYGCMPYGCLKTLIRVFESPVRVFETPVRRTRKKFETPVRGFFPNDPNTRKADP